MLVKNYMTCDVICTNENQSILQAAEELRGNRHHSMPVVDDVKRVLGLLSEKEIVRACPADINMLSKQEANSLLGRFKVKNLMRKDVITVHPEDSVEFVAYQFYKYDVPSFPVVDEDNRLVGIISQKDIFKAFMQIMAMGRSCTRLTIETKDKVGVVAELAALFRDANINILSLVPRVLQDGTATINIRCETGDKGLGIVGKISDAGYKVLDVSHYDGVK